MTRYSLVTLFMLLTAPAFAQLGIETTPGVTRYGGDTLGVEIIPGVTQFSGRVNGSAIEIVPGITHYNFNSMDAFTDALIERSERENARREQEFRQQNLERRLRETEREIKALRERR